MSPRASVTLECNGDAVPALASGRRRLLRMHENSGVHSLRKGVGSLLLTRWRLGGACRVVHDSRRAVSPIMC